MITLFFVGAGLTHFVKPRFYLDIMPPRIPHPKFWVAFTGICEIAGGLGLLIPETRAAAGWSLIALLVCVFPANVRMLQIERGSIGKKAALVARLPLQGVLIWWVYASIS